MRVAGHARGDADQHLLAPVAGFGRDALQDVELVQRVDNDVADARGERFAELGRGLRVPVEVDPRGVEAALERKEKLTARGDITREALIGEQPVHRRARKRFRREQHVEVGVAGGRRLHERPRPGADVVLGDDVRRSAELARELDCVAASDLEPSALVDSRPERIDVRESRGRGHAVVDHATPAIIDACLGPGRSRQSSRGRSASTPVCPTRCGCRDWPSLRAAWSCCMAPAPPRRTITTSLAPRSAPIWPRSCSTSGGTARATARWTAGSSMTSPRWRRSCAPGSADPRRSRCAGRAWAATSRSCPLPP